MDWQQYAALGLVALAVLYLAWRQVRLSSAGGCAACSANPQEPPDDLIQLEAAAASDPPADAATRN